MSKKTESKWIVNGHHYTCPACKKTMAIEINKNDGGFEFCPFCGKKMSGQRTENGLLPCTCGGEAYIRIAISLDDLYSGHVIIACASCGASVFGQTIEQATAQWNRSVKNGNR